MLVNSENQVFRSKNDLSKICQYENDELDDNEMFDTPNFQDFLEKAAKLVPISLNVREEQPKFQFGPRPQTSV
jgi:hypothetical protein